MFPRSGGCRGGDVLEGAGGVPVHDVVDVGEPELDGGVLGVGGAVLVRLSASPY